MPYAVELYFDPDAEARVRELWHALDDAGITSLGAVPGTWYHPHVSMFAFDDADLAAVEDAALHAMRGLLGLQLPLASLGFFLTEESVAFLGVAPSLDLLNGHRAAVAALVPHVTRPWPYYLPDALVPHCTLATNVADKGAVVGVVERFELPIMARAESVNLVDVITGSSVLHVTTRA